MVGSSRVFNTLYALIVATERRIPLKFPKIRQFLLFFRLFLCQNGIESRKKKSEPAALARDLPESIDPSLTRRVMKNSRLESQGNEPNGVLARLRFAFKFYVSF